MSMGISHEAQPDDGEYVPEEEVTSIPGWTPSVTLQVQETATGEEDEDVTYSQRSKLYRFRDNEWKERGLGDSKLLKHKTTGQVRFLFRQDKTLKVVANFYVIDAAPYCELSPNAGSEKCWVWCAQDYSEGELQVEQFALKFSNAELAQAFKKAFDEAKAQNGTLGTDAAGTGQANGGGATTAAAPASKKEEKPSLFSSSDAAPTTSLFGNASQTTSSLFGDAKQTTSLFGNAQQTTSLFGAPKEGEPATSLFGAPKDGGQPKSLFGSASTAGDAANPFANVSFPSRTGEAATTGASEEAAQQDDEYVVEEEVTTVPGWAPSVTLEVKEIETGEENEAETYSQRSKLYRFKDGDWKERGLGDAKLLKHKDTGKIRFMLRQEKTGKIVANHYVIDKDPYCDLRPNAGSEKCWVWTSQDCADGEMVTEQFALKFGTAELAQKFKEAFDEAKVQNAKVIDLDNAESPGEKTSTVTEPSKKDADTTKVSSSQDGAKDANNPFAGMSLFGNSASSGSSGGLFGAATSGGLFANGGTSKTQASSGGLFGSPSTAASTGGLFSASTPAASTGGLFGSPSTAASTGGLFGSPSTAASSGGLFSSASTGGLFGSASTGGLFGAGSTGSLFGTPSTTESASSSGGLFGNSTGGLFSNAAPTPASTGGLFGSASKASTGGLFDAKPTTGSLFQTSAASSGGGLFGSTAGGTGGLFGAKSDAPAEPTADAAKGDEDEYVVEEEVTTVPGWAPSVTLELKEVTTGEEDEEEIYSQRSKLYRYKDGDWKERGLGDSKLLKHKATGKVRFMLRQEKTGKIVANHYVIDKAPYCELRPNAGSEKCWVWTAQDYSDGEAVTEQFALKFGTAELAKKFKEAFDNAKVLNSKAISLGGETQGSDKPKAKEDEKKPPSLFGGGSTTQSNNLFGTGDSKEAKSIFGASTGALFGAASATDSKESKSIFGASDSKETKSIFGASDTKESKSIFGSSSNQGVLSGTKKDTYEGYYRDSGGDAQWEGWGEGEWDGEYGEYDSKEWAGYEGWSGYGQDYNEDGEEEGEEEDDEEADQWISPGDQVKDAPASLADLAKAQQSDDKWKCEVCGCRWPQPVQKCGACDTPRPGLSEEEMAAAEKAAAAEKEAAMKAFLGTSGPAPAPTGFNFAQPAASGAATNIFGAPAAASPFTAATSSAPALGTPATTPSLFGSPAATSGGSLFGGASAAPAPAGASLFGGPQSSAPSLFGGATAPMSSSGATSLFGASAGSGSMFSIGTSSSSSSSSGATAEAAPSAVFVPTGANAMPLGVRSSGDGAGSVDVQKEVRAVEERILQQVEKKIEDQSRSQKALLAEITELRKELKGEKSMREAYEEMHEQNKKTLQDFRKDITTLQTNVNKMGTQNDASGEVKRMSEDLGAMREGLLQLERDTQERLRAVEQEMAEVRKKEVRNMSFPDRIMHFEKEQRSKTPTNGTSTTTTTTPRTASQNRSLNLLRRQP
eukprot:gnl/MRDRNA2_/MRDRNA2_106638_c0_seq1.p1 gnl/MRDRNA2_/MRDRNA2_106638_c0~~gnl/MRDRNA2_/MRDRNA2_106638_c0_seq1.p1  ORF type:complete len:1475 (+),score=417.25 gnl/MRDRNA2_/MRDRNA2_106638_c0_seq1:99-4523(+)